MAEDFGELSLEINFLFYLNWVEYHIFFLYLPCHVRFRLPCLAATGEMTFPTWQKI